MAKQQPISRTFKYKYVKSSAYQLSVSDKLLEVLPYPAFFSLTALATAIYVLPILKTGMLLTILSCVLIVALGVLLTVKKWKDLKEWQTYMDKVEMHAFYAGMLSVEDLRPVTEWLINNKIYPSSNKWGYDASHIQETSIKIFTSLQKALNNSELGQEVMSWEVGKNILKVRRIDTEEIEVSAIPTANKQ